LGALERFVSHTFLIFVFILFFFLCGFAGCGQFSEDLFPLLLKLRFHVARHIDEESGVIPPLPVFSSRWNVRPEGV